jgi:hypothetical protein
MSFKGAHFKHKSDVQKWLDIIRGQYAPKAVESLGGLAKNMTRSELAEAQKLTREWKPKLER